MRILIIGCTGLIGSAIHARLADSRDTTAYWCRAIQRGQRMRITSRSMLHRRPTPPDGGPFSPASTPSSTRRAPCRDRTCRACMLPAAPRFMPPAKARRPPRDLFSAIGTNRAAPSDFSRTKQEGEAALMARDLDWVVLRPSVVVGRAAYGGSALLRGLASLPVLPDMPGTAPIQPVHLDDVIETVVFFLKPGAPARIGPGSGRTAADGVQRRRRPVSPLAAMAPGLPFAIAGVGGRHVVSGGRRGADAGLAHARQLDGAGGNAAWRNGRLRALASGDGYRAARSKAALASEPASVQERWFARLYALKPLIFGVFGLFWIVTGIISLGSRLGNRHVLCAGRRA